MRPPLPQQEGSSLPPRPPSRCTLLAAGAALTWAWGAAPAFLTASGAAETALHGRERRLRALFSMND